MKTYNDCKWSFLNPTQKEALRNILNSIKADENPSILDLEELGCLTSTGRVKK